MIDKNNKKYFKSLNVSLIVAVAAFLQIEEFIPSPRNTGAIIAAADIRPNKPNVSKPKNLATNKVIRNFVTKVVRRRLKRNIV